MGYEEERDRSGHRRSRRAKPSEMEDDGLTLITDSFTERREDGSHRSGDRSRSGQKAAKKMCIRDSAGSDWNVLFRVGSDLFHRSGGRVYFIDQFESHEASTGSGGRAAEF